MGENEKKCGSAAPVGVSLIIPAFNEAGNVRLVVEDSRQALAEGELGDCEIIIVDDGSRDATPAEADKLASEYPDVRVIHHPENRGIGAALKTGYAVARGEVVTATCADGEVAIREVISLIRMMDEADLVVSRRIRDMGAHRELFTSGFHFITRLMLGYDLHGMEGIYVIRRSVLQGLDLYSDTSLVNLEVIMQCIQAGCRIRTGEITAYPRLSGQSKMTNVRAIFRVFWEVLKLRVHLWRREKPAIRSVPRLGSH